MTNDDKLLLRRWQYFVIAMLIGTLTIGGLASVYQNTTKRQQHQAERELQVISRLQGMSLHAWREQRLTDAAVLSDNALLGHAVVTWMRSSGFTEHRYLQSQLERDLRVLQEQRNYSAAYLVDLDGRVRLSSRGPLDRRMPDAEMLALQQALEQAEPVVVEPRRNDALRDPLIRIPP